MNVFVFDGDGLCGWPASFLLSNLGPDTISGNLSGRKGSRMDRHITVLEEILCTSTRTLEQRAGTPIRLANSRQPAAADTTRARP